MARGKHSNTQLPRKSSPEGVRARQERRIKVMPQSQRTGEYTRPGSANSRKVGR